MSGLETLSSYVLLPNKAENNDELRKVFAKDEGLNQLVMTIFHKAFSKLTIANHHSDFIAALLDYHDG